MGSYTWQAGKQGAGNGSGMAQVGGMRSGGTRKMGLGLRIAAVMVGLLMMVEGKADLVGAMFQPGPLKRTEQAVQVEGRVQRSGGEVELRREADAEQVEEPASEAEKSPWASGVGQVPGAAVRRGSAGHGSTEQIVVDDGEVLVSVGVPAHGGGGWPILGWWTVLR